ncbi:MAG: hypothetical protein AMJ88_15555 [Anaerolineae bacterium SM23_ 63]|nr:MAG: hypothetical protein AMJ88_15555 [Anaerolineae bacterium SM23_ 63]
MTAFICEYAGLDYHLLYFNIKFPWFTLAIRSTQIPLIIMVDMGLIFITPTMPARFSVIGLK